MRVVELRQLVTGLHGLKLRMLAAVVCLIFLSACGEPAEVEYPDAVPADARWVGGADGGVFVVIKPDEGAKAGRNQITVYFENGDVWLEDQTELSDHDLEGLTGWDGTTLYFNDGSQRVLVR